MHIDRNARPHAEDAPSDSEPPPLNGAGTNGRIADGLALKRPNIAGGKVCRIPPTMDPRARIASHAADPAERKRSFHSAPYGRLAAPRVDRSLDTTQALCRVAGAGHLEHGSTAPFLLG